MWVAACGGDDQAAGSDPGQATCQEVFDNAAAQCSEGGWPPVAQCEDDAVELESIGCAAWGRWLACAASAEFTCDGLFAACDEHWQGIQQCRAMQAATGCIRITSVDDNCASATPFAFACLSGTPSGQCEPLETSAAVPYFCCAGQ